MWRPGPTGKIVARHRGDEFTFTSELALPWVDSVSNVEFSGLADDIETDEGDENTSNAGFGTGDDPEPIDDDPSGFLAGMSRDARNGGNIDPTFIPDETEAKNRIIARSNNVNLSARTRGAVGSQAGLIGSVMETAKRQIRRGADFTLPKVATSHFHPDNVVPPVPHVLTETTSPSGDTDTSPPPPPAQPEPSGTGTPPTDPTPSGPEPDPMGDHGKGRPWGAPGPVHERKKQQREVRVETPDAGVILLDAEELLRKFLDVDQTLRDDFFTDIASLVGTVPAAVLAARIVKELGIKDQVRETVIKGRPVLVISGYAGNRSILSGTVYKLGNPEVVSLGLGRKGETKNLIRVHRIVAVAYTTIDILHAFLQDEAEMSVHFGRLAADFAKLAAVAGATVIAGALIAPVALPAGVVALFGFVIGVGVGVGLNWLDDNRLEKEIAKWLDEFGKIPQLPENRSDPTRLRSRYYP